MALERGCIFNPVNHAYLRDGVVVPSVTRCLDHSGLVSYQFVQQEILERKGQLGTAVHLATHFYDIGDLDWSSLDDETKARTEAWQSFRVDTGFVPNRIEEPFITTVNGMSYGMTVDRIGIFRKQEAVVELKTSATEQKFWAIQLAGYALGVPGENGASPLARFSKRRRIAVQLLRGKYRLFDYADVSDASVFLSGLHIATWKLQKGEKLRKIEEAA